jgi:hypothetical protein
MELPTGELARVAVGDVGTQPDELEELTDPGPAGVAVTDVVRAERFGDRIPDW